MDERKIYSFIVALVCFILMAVIRAAVAIYTWIAGGFKQQAATAPEPTAIVETTNVSD